MNPSSQETQNLAQKSDLILEQARESSLSLLPPKFIFVPLDSIGVHEKPNNLRTDQLIVVLNSLLSNGYRGPAISVLESSNDSIYESLEPNKTKVFDNLRYGQVGIADGHNRLAALRILNSLGLLKLKHFPVQIIPGRKPELVAIRASKEEETPLTVEDIEKCFTDPNETIDPSSTSHFEAAFRDNKWRRVREGQPDIVINREDLIDLEKLRQLENHLEVNSKILSVLESYSLDIDTLQQILSSLN